MTPEFAEKYGDEVMPIIQLISLKNDDQLNFMYKEKIKNVPLVLKKGFRYKIPMSQSSRNIIPLLNAVNTASVTNTFFW